MIAAYLAAAAGLLYFLYVLIMGNRRDRVLAALRRKNRDEELKEIARLEQEIKDAKIAYSNSRSEYDHLTGEGSDAKLFDESDESDKIKEACDKALKDADQVIAKQGKLILTIGQQNSSLTKENQELSDALVKLNKDYDSEIKNAAVIGGAGLLVGILIGILIPR